MPKPTRNSQQVDAFLKSIPENVKLRLRDDALPGAKIREFLFKGIGENGKVLLAPAFEDYTWEGNFDDIDWEEYMKRKTSAPKRP